MGKVFLYKTGQSGESLAKDGQLISQGNHAIAGQGRDWACQYLEKQRDTWWLGRESSHSVLWQAWTMLEGMSASLICHEKMCILNSKF